MRVGRFAEEIVCYAMLTRPNIDGGFYLIMKTEYYFHADQLADRHAYEAALPTRRQL